MGLARGQDAASPSGVEVIARVADTLWRACEDVLLSMRARDTVEASDDTEQL